MQMYSTLFYGDSPFLFSLPCETGAPFATLKILRENNVSLKCYVIAAENLWKYLTLIVELWIFVQFYMFPKQMSTNEHLYRSLNIIVSTLCIFCVFCAFIDLLMIIAISLIKLKKIK